MISSLLLLLPELKLSFSLLVTVLLRLLLVLLEIHMQVGLPYCGELPLSLRPCSYHPLQEEVQFFLPLVILRLLQLLLDHLQTNSCSLQMFSSSTVWKHPWFFHLLLSAFDVIHEFVGFLKNLGFVFSGEVVKPRISKHLENTGGL